MKRFTDCIDATPVIALFEYGYLRNPATDRILICLNPSSKEHTKKNPPVMWFTHISYDEVFDALFDADDGFYSFIGSDRKTELRELHNDHLTHMIHSLNAWSGDFSRDY